MSAQVTTLWATLRDVVATLSRYRRFEGGDELRSHLSSNLRQRLRARLPARSEQSAIELLQR